MSSSRHLEAAGYSIASNILVQVISRGFTFILGAITLKHLQSSSLLGIINVRLALLYTTLQFLSREPFRRGCLSQAASSNIKTWPKIVNTIWLGTLTSFVYAIPMAHIWQLNSPSQEDLAGTTVADYQTAVLVTCLAVFVEMLEEPGFIYAQAKALTDHNPRVEIVYVTLRCVLIAFFTILESNSYKLGRSSQILTKIAFCQVFASCASVIYSYTRLRSNYNLSLSTFLPSMSSQKKHDGNIQSKIFDYECLKLSFSFGAQSYLKQALTEGERFIMTFFNVISLSEQGIYDVVNNLGCMAARLVFKPVEDSGYTLFSQTVKRQETLDIRKFYRVQENLMYLIKAMLLLGLIILVFGYNFVPLIVLYGGEKLNNALAFHLMRWQLFYTPILAVNGITECFIFASMSSSEIGNYNLIMIAFSVLFLLSIYLTQSSLGSACFIFANCLTMLARIACSHGVISKYFEKHGYRLVLRDTMPSLTTIISLKGVFIFLSISQHYLLDMSQPLSVIFGLILGGWCLLFIIHVIMCHEDDLIRFTSRLFKLKLN